MSTVIFELEKQYHRNIALESIERGDRPVNMMFLSGGKVAAWEGKGLKDVGEGNFFPAGELNLQI